MASTRNDFLANLLRVVSFLVGVMLAVTELALNAGPSDPLVIGLIALLLGVPIGDVLDNLRRRS